jgi:hypothetical protein
MNCGSRRLCASVIIALSIAMGGCESSPEPTILPSGPALAWITIAPGTANVVRGDSIALEAATNVEPEFSWFSLDTLLATVRPLSGGTNRAIVTTRATTGDVSVCARAGAFVQGCATIRVTDE